VALIGDVYTRFAVLIHEAARFSAVGILGFGITIGGANALHSGAGLNELLSVTIATVFATTFAFAGNKLWAFRHRSGSHLRRESVMFFVFNGIGLLIQLAFVATARYGLGLTDTFSYNISNLMGITVATVFRLYTYRRWVFLVAVEAVVGDRLQPEISGT
jgi:putative flippase GtrA